MKSLPFFVLAILVLCLNLSVNLFADEPFDIKGFYLGMGKEEVKTIYENFKKQPVAEYVSLEPENYRDLIKLDNEFSSMGNKIEVAYNDSMEAVNITFQYKTVEILFEYGNLDVPEFVKAFSKEYQIPEMSFEDQGMIQIWKYVNIAGNYQISIDNARNLRLQIPKKKQ